MIVKAVLLFLIFIGVLAMFGRLRIPGAKRLSTVRCSECGRLRIGKARCPCGRG